MAGWPFHLNLQVNLGQTLYRLYTLADFSALLGPNTFIGKDIYNNKGQAKFYLPDIVSNSETQEICPCTGRMTKGVKLELLNLG